MIAAKITNKSVTAYILNSANYSTHQCGPFETYNRAAGKSGTGVLPKPICNSHSSSRSKRSANFSAAQQKLSARYHWFLDVCKPDKSCCAASEKTAFR